MIRNEIRIKSQKTLVDWGSFCREVCFDLMVENGKPMGGPGRTVEIDESKFGRRKYNKGHRVEGQWVFGMVCRETGEVMLLAVEKRDAATLVPIIQKWILPETTIISDCWKAYGTLGNIGYEHLTVNHSITFKDPETGAHTNQIESTWNATKRTLPPSGRKKAFFGGYLARYMLKKQCALKKEDPFRVFMTAAGQLYQHPNAYVRDSDASDSDMSEDESI
jgi:transposase-like protein